jgi:serine/threonine protein phosphatase PrpC
LENGKPGSDRRFALVSLTLTWAIDNLPHTLPVTTLAAPAHLNFGPSLDVAAATSVGVRPYPGMENQDNFLLIDVNGEASFLREGALDSLRVPDWPVGHARIAVLDGMGGHGNGREAAEAVVSALLSTPACTDLAELAHRLDSLHLELQRHFSPLGSDPGRRPGTTLTMLEVPASGPALLYHVGDSRLYRMDGEQLTPLTVDHVPATAYAMSGLLDEASWWNQVHGEHRSHISQAFILGNALTDPAVLNDPLFALSPINLPGFLYHLPDRRTLELNAGETYLLATDGFWACDKPYPWVSSWPPMLKPARTSQAKLARLFDTVMHEPPPKLHIDNLTAIIIKRKAADDASFDVTQETAIPIT